MIQDSTASSGGFGSWGPNFSDQAVWATEDDYRAWNSNETPSNSQNRSGSEPPNKKSRNVQGLDPRDIVTSSSKAIGKMFYKTKLCCKFRAGVCPYITNCNFAHGIEELRKPPPNWQDIVAAHESERGGGGGVLAVEPREEHQIPILTSPDLRGESQRSTKGRHCKKFYTEEGCPYGDSCTFLHDEQSRARESVAISVTPTVGGFGNNATGTTLKPSNWKTRICNKWETTGYCPFGSKCHFAHGAAGMNAFFVYFCWYRSCDFTVYGECCKLMLVDFNFLWILICLVKLWFGVKCSSHKMCVIMLRWICGYTSLDNIINNNIKNVQVAHTDDKSRESHS